MKSTYISVLEFMDDHFGIYTNPYGIEFCMNNDNSMCVDCLLPDKSLEEYMNLELFYSCESIFEFMQDFKISSVKDIEMVTSDFLWKLYYQGKAEICCAVDVNIVYFSLSFHYHNNKIIVKNDDRELAHENPELLKTPGEFIEYTQRLFQIT